MTCKCLRDEMARYMKIKRVDILGKSVGPEGDTEDTFLKQMIYLQVKILKSTYLVIRRYIMSLECFDTLKLPLIKQPTLRKQCHMTCNCFQVPGHIPLLIWNSTQQKYNQQTHIYQHRIEIISPYIYPTILNIEHIRRPSCCKACKE